MSPFRLRNQDGHQGLGLYNWGFTQLREKSGGTPTEDDWRVLGGNTVLGKNLRKRGGHLSEKNGIGRSQGSTDFHQKVLGGHEMIKGQSGRRLQITGCLREGAIQRPLTQKVIRARSGEQ